MQQYPFAVLSFVSSSLMCFALLSFLIEMRGSEVEILRDRVARLESQLLVLQTENDETKAKLLAAQV